LEQGTNKKLHEEVKAMKEGKKRIEFRIVSPQAEKVYLCGSFNNWSQSSDPMKKDGTETWKKTKMLSVGTHEYKFSVDGEWTLDPECPDTTPNEFGTENNILRL
jgi:5'-AMP-activated protein kinase regulatory beta subunit